VVLQFQCEEEEEVHLEEGGPVLKGSKKKKTIFRYKAMERVIANEKAKEEAQQVLINRSWRCRLVQMLEHHMRNIFDASSLLPWLGGSDRQWS